MNIRILILFLIGFICSSCKEVVWNLERNNPIDSNNPKGSPQIKFSRYVVVFDDNGNGVVNRNESVKLKIFLKNVGTRKANKVRATITCKNPYIISLSPSNELAYNSRSLTTDDFIPVNEERFGFAGAFPVDYTISFSNVGAYAGASPTFNIEITDESGGRWSDSFQVTLH